MNDKTPAEVTKEFEQTVACFGMDMVTTPLDEFANAWGWNEVPSRAAVLYTPKRTIIAAIFEEGAPDANQNVSFWVSDELAHRDTIAIYTRDGDGSGVISVCATLDVVAEC